MKKMAFFALVPVAGLLAYFNYTINLPTEKIPTTKSIAPLMMLSPTPMISSTLPATKSTPVKMEKLILHKVDFISQAPTGKWSDPRQEDGCEEASALMALYWARENKIPTKATLEKQIIAISDWENKNFKEYRDTSAQDTAERILKKYSNFNNFEVKNNISSNNIKQELYSGNIVIIPVNGIKLKNPNFVSPGPEHHMILIIGYDPQIKQFIANDPGTRLGAGYRYSEKIINEALRDYPTGRNKKVTDVKKNMIVIKPENLSSPISTS